VWIETILGDLFNDLCPVTLLAGVWIETKAEWALNKIAEVTLLAGVWIETRNHQQQSKRNGRSRSLRACGLKLCEV